MDNNHTQTSSPPHLDLYTIPTHSCWFSWDSIHDTERISLREFFDGSSFTRTARTYKEYRDFIISKYREDPSRRLTFTEVRKSLVGDVCVLRKVFDFLDKWGLINFGAPSAPVGPTEVEDEERVRVRVEEGAPFGVRVVVAPGSLKPLIVPGAGGGGNGGGGGGAEFRLRTALASYEDVFGREKEKVVKCGSCKEKCDSKYYQCSKDNCVICLKCFDKGALEENKSRDDYRLNDCSESGTNQAVLWTEAETLLLLESVLKHGDDWELVAQNVHTKTKLECISRLIELPFGELMLGSRDKFSTRAYEGPGGKDQNASTGFGISQHTSTAAGPEQNTGGSVGASQSQKPFSEATQENITSADSGLKKLASTDASQQQKALSAPCTKEKISSDAEEEQKPTRDALQEQKGSSEFQINMVEDNHHQELVNNRQQHIEHNHLTDQMENGGEIEDIERPLKKSRIDTSDPSRSLMEQVALISTMVGPRITAAAASAAVIALSDGNPLVRDIFYLEDPDSAQTQKSGNLDMELERASHSEDLEMKDASNSSELDKISSAKESIPLALRTRAAVGTALGTAAAHARLLADQEEREIEHLMAFIIETQLKKLETKVKLFEDLEHIMEKEHALIEESKASVIAQRLDILQRIIGAGKSRFRDYSSLRLSNGTL